MLLQDDALDVRGANNLSTADDVCPDVQLTDRKTEEKKKRLMSSTGCWMAAKSMFQA